MTPKEKSQELVNKFIEFTRVFDDCSGWVDDIISAKQCALIAVDDIIYEVYSISHQYTAIYNITTSSYLYTDCKELLFWKEVKQEIEKL